ncbi:MAG: hypothetical protein ACK56I_11210, partial [bacterium]
MTSCWIDLADHSNAVGFIHRQHRSAVKRNRSGGAVVEEGDGQASGGSARVSVVIHHGGKDFAGEGGWFTRVWEAAGIMVYA